MGPPVVIFLSFCGMSKTVMRYSAGGGGYYAAGPLREDVIALPELRPPHTDDLTAAIRLLTGPVWNAFGQRQPAKGAARQHG